MATSPWYELTPDAVAEALAVDPRQGLDDDQVRRRLADAGPNRLPDAAPRSVLVAFAQQCRSLLILVLLGAAVLAGVVGDLKDTAVILVVVLCNAVIGVMQEHRAERSLAALKGMTVATARVRRAGHMQQVEADRLVPGDVVLLEAGDRVPADGRIIFAAAAEIDESALTGESQPAAKSVEALPQGGVGLGDRRNTAHGGTAVTRGRIEMLVTLTGSRTEMGRIATLLAETTPSPTPLQRDLDILARRLAVVAVGAVTAMAALAFARGEALRSIVLAAVALGVAAIPEGLPAVVTVTLALGTARMAKRGAIVKRLASVETLGATTVVCSDKTGTLTTNRMAACAVFAGGVRLRVTGEAYDDGGTIAALDGLPAPDLRPLCEALVLCNDSRIAAGRLIGDPTEGALLALAANAGVKPDLLAEANPRLAELPFDSSRKFMATLHRDGDAVRVFVKGATDVLLRRCVQVVGRDGMIELDESIRSHLDAEMESMAGEGMRVLAAATRTLSSGDVSSDEAALDARLHGLTLLGLVGIKDPPRAESAEAIARCHAAGIRVMMITGDHATTAAAVASEIGILGEVLTGAALDDMSDSALAERLPGVGVVARVAPEHKVRIVRALQAAGAVVAMTGDGVNDAPALKGADIGVAMGITGTAVTKEAAAMVLADDNFATIVDAVHEGRTIYDNIVTFVRFQLSTNLGAIMSVLGAQVIGISTPFSPLHMLWVNLIMDGPPAMALGVDPSRPGLMREAPRRADASLLSFTRLLRLGLSGLVMASGTLAVATLGPYASDDPRAATLAFTTFVLFQVGNALSVRDEYASVLRRESLRNRSLWAALAAVVGLQALVIQWPAASALFGTTPLAGRDWLLATGVATTVVLVDECRKALGRRRTTSRLMA